MSWKRRLAIRAAKFGPEADFPIKGSGRGSYYFGISTPEKKRGIVEGALREQ